MPGVRFQDAALGPNAARGKLCRWTTAPTLPCRTNQKLLGQPQESSPATSIAFAPNATTSFACPLISSMPSSAQSATKVSSTLSFFFHVALTFMSARPLPVAPASWRLSLSRARHLRVGSSIVYRELRSTRPHARTISTFVVTSRPAAARVLLPCYFPHHD